MNEKKESLLFRFMIRVIRRVYPVPEISGTENLPDEPCLIVSNHAKTHGPIIVDSRPQTFNKIGVVVARMELDKFNLFLLFVCQKGVIIKVSIADNIRSDFLCKV